MAQKTKGGFLPTLVVIAVLGVIAFVAPWGSILGTGKRPCSGPSTVQLVASFAPNPRQDPVQAGHAVNGGKMNIENTTKMPWIKIVPVQCGDTVEFLVAQQKGTGDWVRCHIIHEKAEVKSDKSNRDHPNTAYCVYEVE